MILLQCSCVLLSWILQKLWLKLSRNFSSLVVVPVLLVSLHKSLIFPPAFRISSWKSIAVIISNASNIRVFLFSKVINTNKRCNEDLPITWLNSLLLWLHLLLWIKYCYGCFVKNKSQSWTYSHCVFCDLKFEFFFCRTFQDGLWSQWNWCQYRHSCCYASTRCWGKLGKIYNEQRQRYAFLDLY